MNSLNPQSATGARSYATEPRRKPAWRRARMRTYVLFLLKNLVGWLLILSSPFLGFTIPGPGGIPLFLIGFALITFPGKRRMTARFLSGRPIGPESRAYQWIVAVLSAVLPAAGLWYLIGKGHLPHARDVHWGTIVYMLAWIGASLVLWWLGLRSLPLVNRFMRGVPRLRRRFRPWLRRRGLDVLPRRRRIGRMHPLGHVVYEPDNEILEIHQRHRTRASAIWVVAKPWLRRAAALGITAAIFVWMFQPVVRDWPLVRDRVRATDWGRFALASVMFAMFLFAVRTLSWRTILSSFGYRLPVAAATRVWSMSELARYLPGMIWQVVGRQYLVKPYGVRGSVCSASQVIELAVFLLANVLVAVSCLLFFGIKKIHGQAEIWLYVAMGLVPVLLALLHPNVLYRILNAVMRGLSKPTIERRMSFAQLAGLLAWAVAGVLFQCWVIWFLIHPLLGLPLAKWWVVAGAYSLAWCAGFIAFWAPGGIGVRELVFVVAMDLALPPAVRRNVLEDPATRWAFLVFLGVLLRLWATCGELLLAGVAHLLDYRGALNRDDAPGRERLVPIVGATPASPVLTPPDWDTPS